MEAPLTCKTRNKHCVSIKNEHQVKTKKELIRKLFKWDSKEIAIVKFLPETIHTNCFGCVHDYLSQREHDSLMMDKEESVNMYFEEIVKKIDFLLINHLVMWRFG